MQSKCSSNSKIFNSKYSYFLNTIEIILLTLIIFGILYYYYFYNSKLNTNISNNKSNIDRFADTIDENKWISYTKYNVNPTTGNITPTNITFGNSIKQNLDTDRYLAMDSPNPSNPLATIDYSTLDLKGLNKSIKTQSDNVKNMSNILQKINDIDARTNKKQIDDNNKLIDILSNDITQKIFDNINQQNNMAYKLLLQDKYNSTHLN